MFKQENREELLNRLLKIAIIIGAMIAFVLLCNYVFPISKVILKFLMKILLPFILAVVFTILLKPAIRFMQKRLEISLGAATLVCMILALGIIGLVLVSISSRLLMELTRITYNLPNLTAYLWGVVEKFRTFYTNLRPEDIATINEMISRISSLLSEGSIGIVNGAIRLLSLTPNVLMVLVVTIISTYFFCRDEHRIIAALTQLLPSRAKKDVLVTYYNFGKVLAAYFRALLTLILITTTISIIGLSILKVDYAFTMGLIIGFFDILPILGPATIYIPWIISLLFMKQFQLAFGLMVLYGTVYITRQILEPRIVGHQLGIHPLLTLMSIFVGYQIFGVLGLALGPISVVFFTAIFRSRIS